MTPGTVKAKLHNNRYDKTLCDNEQTICRVFKACRSLVTDCCAKIRRYESSAYNLKAAFNLCLSPPQWPVRVVGRLGRGKNESTRETMVRGKGRTKREIS